jgi:hypothetical protein
VRVQAAGRMAVAKSEVLRKLLQAWHGRFCTGPVAWI